jgi:hypothetical protein
LGCDPNPNMVRRTQLIEPSITGRAHNLLEGTEARMAPRAAWEEKRVGLIYGEGQVFIYLQ